MTESLRVLFGAGLGGMVLTSGIAWGWPVGRRLLGNGATGAAFGAMIGLAALSRGALILAELGMLSRGALAALLLIPLLMGWRNLRPACLAFQSGAPSGGALVPLILFLALLLYPASAAPVVFWDSRVYHLGLPELWVETGSLTRAPKFEYSFYPHLGEAIQCYGFLLADPDPAHVIIAAIPIFLVGFLFGGGNLLWSLLLGTPAFLIMALLSKTTSWFGLVSAAAFIPFLAPHGKRAATIASGLAFGLSLASHYGAFYLLPLLIYFWIKNLPPHLIAVAIAISSVVACPEYLSNIFASGNPLFPFFSNIPATRNLLSFADLAAIVTPWKFEPLGIGSTWGILLPFCAIGALIVDKSRRTPLLLAIATLSVAVLLQRHPRYAIGASLLIMFLAASACSGHAATRRFPARQFLARQFAIIFATMGLVELFLILFIFVGNPTPLAVAAGMSHRAYLETRVSDSPLARWARENLPARPVVASLGILRIYGWAGRIEAVTETVQPAIIDACRGYENPTDIVRDLHAQGFTHLAIDFLEWNRLEETYGHARMSADDSAKLQRVVDASRIVASGRETILLELPK